MSVVIAMKFQGDVATFRQAVTDRAEDFAKLAPAARASGGIHHRFAVGDGFVLVVDDGRASSTF